MAQVNILLYYHFLKVTAKLKEVCDFGNKFPLPSLSEPCPHASRLNTHVHLMCNPVTEHCIVDNFPHCHTF